MALMTIVEALRQAIREEMQRDPRVFCIGEDIGVQGGWGGAFTVTLGLSEEFGHDRILDTPISELGFTGVAVGAAIGGLRPIADVQYADFLFLAMEISGIYVALFRWSWIVFKWEFGHKIQELDFLLPNLITLDLRPRMAVIQEMLYHIILGSDMMNGLFLELLQGLYKRSLLEV